MNYRIINCEQGTEAWLNARKGKLTASVAGEIITPTGRPSKSMDGLIRRLARECVLDDPLAFSGNVYTNWGHTYEPIAREAFRDETGMDVIEVGFCERVDYPVLGCSPDGLIQQDGAIVSGLEIKCLTVDNHVDALLEGIMPAKYAPQVHFSMAITGVDSWYFMAYFPELNPLIVKVERDEYTEKMFVAAVEFAERYSIEAPKIWDKILPKEKQ